jgi:hypothetical protein
MRYPLITVTIEPDYSEQGERIYVVRERKFRSRYDENPKVTETMASRSYEALVDVLHPAR